MARKHLLMDALILSWLIVTSICASGAPASQVPDPAAELHRGARFPTTLGTATVRGIDTLPRVDSEYSRRYRF